MRHTAVFTVEPPSYFGLPEGVKTVIAVTPGMTVYGPTVDAHTGKVVGHGTLSRYRTDDEAFHLAATIEGARITASDNFFHLQFEVAEHSEAVAAAIKLFGRFIRHLEVAEGDYFRFTLESVEADDGWIEANPIAVDDDGRFALTFFNIPALESSAITAAARAHLADARLERALLYYEHSRLLKNLSGHVSPLSDHHQLLMTSSFLSMWKAITTILGDPSTDRDYQSRFRTIGLPKNFWEDNVKPLKAVRDSFDVAHYSLDESAVGAVEARYADANLVCRKVIAQYSVYLIEQEASS